MVETLIQTIYVFGTATKAGGCGKNETRPAKKEKRMSKIARNFSPKIQTAIMLYK